MKLATKISDLTADQLTSASFYQKLYDSSDFKDSMTRGELTYKLVQRAKDLKIKTHVEKQIREIERKLQREEKQAQQSAFNIGVTAFTADSTGRSYPDMDCGSWIATDDGIQSRETSRANQIACYHPILPIKRMRNLQTGEEQITIAFKRGDFWSELTVPKDMIANSRSITTLAKYGVGVTSEGAKLLVKYLADVENYNEDKIFLYQSSSKLGWHDRNFLPYDKGIVFDAESKFPQILHAITENGSYSTWLDHASKIRSDPYVEPRIALAASFSSVLIKFLGIASVIVDFWGMTEAGKTVMLMLAASVWACPDEGQYMGDFLTTDAELEVRSDTLNNLPLILDDTAKMKKSIRENIEQVIYNLSSGSGKKRSNKELGSERVRTWKNTIIINGEKPLSSFVEQGGAINRILEIGLSEEHLFEDPSATADIIRDNYGFAGRVFVEKLKEIDPAEIRKVHKKYCDALTSADTMQKQVIGMAAILTADEFATEWIFQDGKSLNPDDVTRYLSSRNQVSDGARCYEYLLGEVLEKGQHFDLEFGSIDQWGEIEYVNGVKYINFHINAFNELMKKAGFSRKAFTSWAKREGLLRWNTSKDRDVYGVKQPDGRPQARYISVKAVDWEDHEEEKHMFE